MMTLEKFEVNGFKGYRFIDASGKPCTLQQSTNGLMLGVNLPHGSSRLHLDEEMAMWLCRMILDYVDIGSI